MALSSTESPSTPRDGGGVVRVHVPYRIAAVTGTNGKTTTTTMIDAIGARAGDVMGRVTTLGSWVRGERVAEESSLGAMRHTLSVATRWGVKTMLLETTSFALSHGIAVELPAIVGVFTNLSRDHLDYHSTPEEYLAAKAQLFMNLLPGGTAVFNVADPASALLEEVTPPGIRRMTYAARPVEPACSALCQDGPTLSAAAVSVDRRGTHVVLAPSAFAARLGGALRLKVVGHVHAENALAAALAADALGYPAEAIKAGLEGFLGVPGRFQLVEREGDATVVVDYAHTPDALQRTLALAGDLAKPAGGRVLCVFGCGGDRDQGKRPEMGKVAADGADVVIVTTDNPRSEDPDSIVEMILSGLEGRSSGPLRIRDRGRAIREAIRIAGTSDIVVVAGKGHEKTQIFRDRVVRFDDVEVARSALRAVGGESGRMRGK